MAAKRKASALSAAVDDEPVDPSDELAFYCLGGGNEVGRSCHIIQYKGKTVMVCVLNAMDFRASEWTTTNSSDLLQLDAGMHPAKEGFSALPFFDEFDLSTVDILLISQYVGYTSPSPQNSFRRKDTACGCKRVCWVLVRGELRDCTGCRQWRNVIPSIYKPYVSACTSERQ